jgi:hypothetical protein
MGRDLPESAVVVGEDEPLAADDLGRTATSEEHDRVLDAPSIDAVDVLRAQLQACTLEIPFDALEQGGQPHPFVKTDLDPTVPLVPVNAR